MVQINDALFCQRILKKLMTISTKL